MKNWLKISPEGIPWKEYRLLPFLLAAPIAFPVGFWLEFTWRRSRLNAKLVGAEGLPRNAIIYDFHVDVCFNFITVHLLKEAGYDVWFTASHDFDSYLASGPASMGAYRSFRFKRKATEKPLDQIVTMLKEKPDSLLGIFTDGGGSKRNRVRESLVKLAIRSGRPVVPFRSLYSPGFRLFGDDYPRRFSLKGCSVFGKPISAEVLSRMEPEQARKLLEKSLLELSMERLT